MMYQVHMILGFMTFLFVAIGFTHGSEQMQPEFFDAEGLGATSQLISDRVLSLAVDSRYVWVGTDRGLSRYDKRSDQWDNFTVKDGLAHNTVVSIALDSDLAWIGTRDGVSCFDVHTNTWTRYMPRDGLAGRDISCIAVDSRFIWFGTPNGLSRYDKETNSWAQKREKDGLAGDAVTRITIDEDYIWIGTRNGISRYDKLTDSWNNYDTNSGLVDNSVAAIAADGDFVWFGTEEKGLSLYDRRNSDFVRTYTKKDQLASDHIRALAADGTSLWLGTADRGVQRYILSVNTWQQYTVLNPEKTENTAPTGLISNHITAIAPDGNVVWFGTHEHGLARHDLRRGTWKFYGEVKALSDNDVKDVAVTDESVWVATRFGLNQASYRDVAEFSTECNWRTFRKADGLADNYITCVLQVEEDVWVGTPSGLGLRRGDEGEWMFFSTKDGLPHDFVTCLAWQPTIRESEKRESLEETRKQKGTEDEDIQTRYDSRLWIGTKAGISTYEPQSRQWNTYPPPLQISGRVNDIVFDGDFVWIATEYGLVYYDGAAGESGKLTVKDGLPADMINTAAIGNRSIWVGTQSGLSQLSKSSFKTRSPSSATHIPRSNVRAVAVDGRDVWIGTPSGLYCIAGDAFTHYTRESTDGGLVSDNVKAIEIDGGKVWVGTTAGFSVLDKHGKKWSKHSAAATTEVLRSNWVSKLAEDGTDIWFGNWNDSADGAIVKYDRRTDTFRFFDKDDLPLKPTGRPITHIHALTAGENGVWAGTNGGLLRYDKTKDSWRHYTVYDGLPNNEVWSIVFDLPYVWTAHIGGVVSRYSIAMDEWTTFEISPSETWSGIGSIAVDPQYVWVTTMWDGLKRYEKSTGTWTNVTEVHGLGDNEANDLLVDGEHVWVTGWGDASRYNRRTGEWNVFSRWRVLSGPNIYLSRGLDGVWLAYPWLSWGDAIASKYHNKSGSWTTLNVPEIERGYFGRTMQVVESIDSVWFAVEWLGLARYNKGSNDWTFFDEKNGLASGELHEHSIVVDENYVWVGTAGGLGRYDIEREVWTTFTQSPLTPIGRARKVYAIAAEARFVWVGTPNGLHRYDKDTDRWYSPRPRGKDGNMLDNPSVGSIAMDEKYVWLGTNEGVLRYDKAGDYWEVYTDENGLPSNAVRDVAVRSYEVWIATDHGVAVFNRLSDDPNTWESHTQELEIKAMQDVKRYAESLLSNDVRCVGVGDRSIWFGTDKGPCRYDREKKTWMSFFKSVASSSQIAGFSESPAHHAAKIADISVIAVDEDYVWIGTSKGAAKYHLVSGDFDTFTQSDGLASNLVTCIALNHEEIWFGSANAGVTRLNKVSGKWRVFNATDGLLHDRVEAIAFDGDQRWFGTELGLCRYDPKTETWTSYAEDFNP